MCFVDHKIIYIECKIKKIEKKKKRVSASILVSEQHQTVLKQIIFLNCYIHTIPVNR